jgi:glucose uptake protein GlcU
MSGNPQFYPIAMVGGGLWAVANLIVLPCIGVLGLGKCVLLYSFTNCLTNWACGNFGLFGTHARPPKVEWLNYIGLSVLLIGGGLIAFIRPESQTKLATESVIGIVTEKAESVETGLPLSNATTGDPIQLKKVNIKQIVAIVFSLVSGFFYGVDAVPLIYAQDNYVGAPQDGLSYCFAHYMGVFVTSSLVMTVYCVVRKNKPYVNDELTLPSLASGGIWGVAQTLFNCSLKNLSQSVSGPIGAILPSFFASLWAVFYFREIRGTRNFILLFVSMLFTSLGAVSIALSKELEL